MTISQNMLNSIGLLLLATLVGAYMTWYWKVRDARIKRADDLALANERKADVLAIANDKLLTRVAELEKQLGLVGQAVIPLSAAFQAILVRELTHLHTPKLDELLTRIGPPSELSDAEEAEFFRLLKERAEELDDRIPDLERDAATMLPLVMRRVKAEYVALEDEHKPTQMQVVAVPVDDEHGEETNG
jgi:uncharacterized protein YdcH (DUF465 family)